MKGDQRLDLGQIQRRKEREESERLRVERYGKYASPRFAEFIGEGHICQTCYAITADMPKHLAASHDEGKQ